MPRPTSLWVLVVTLLSCMFAWACSQGGIRFLDPDDDPDDPDPGASSGGARKDSGGGSSGSSGSSGTPDRPDGPNKPDSPATGDATEQNLKVAFIGDTASGPDFKTVLDLITAEKADFVMVQGDLTYDGEKAAN